MANNPSLNAKVVTSITKSSSGKTTYNTTGGNAKTSTPKLPSYSGNRSGGNSYSGSGAYRMSADQYDRYEQDYTTWKQTGQHTSGYSSWGNQRDLDTWKSIRDGKVKSARVGNDIYYMDNDSYKRYTKDYDSWSRTGSHSADYGKWANNDGTAAFRYIRDDANGYGGLNNLKASLDDELTKEVAEKYRSQWGDKYYYDVSDPEDIAAMNAGQMPSYLRKKYKTRDPIDQWLMEQGLPYGSLFNDMYSEAWQDRNERNAKKQQTYESAFNDMASYVNGMNGLRNAMLNGTSFEDALATGEYDFLGDYYDSSFGKTKDTDTAGDKYYKSKKTQLDPVYDRAYEAMMNGEVPDDEFFNQYKESSWKSYLRQKQKWNENSFQDVFDYLGAVQAQEFLANDPIHSENFDYRNLPTVSKEAMNAAGYSIEGENSVFEPQIFTSRDKKESIVLNPVRADGTIIPANELKEYASDYFGEAGILGGLFDKKGNDPDGLVVATFESKKEAKEYSQTLKESVDAVYSNNGYDRTQEQEAQYEAVYNEAISAGDVDAVAEMITGGDKELAQLIIDQNGVADAIIGNLDDQIYAIDQEIDNLSRDSKGRLTPSARNKKAALEAERAEKIRGRELVSQPEPEGFDEEQYQSDMAIVAQNEEQMPELLQNWEDAKQAVQNLHDQIDAIDQQIDNLPRDSSGRLRPSARPRKKELEDEKAALEAQYPKLNGDEFRAGNAYRKLEKQNNEITSKYEVRIADDLSANTYSELSQNPDFAEKSASIDSIMAAGFDDPKREARLIDNVLENGTPNNQNKWYSAQYMTDEEKATFRYICNTKGAEAGVEYVEGIMPSLNQRLYDEVDANAKKYADQNGTVSSLGTVFGNLTTGLMEGIPTWVGASMYRLSGGNIGRDLRNNDPRLIGTRYSQAIRGEVGQNIAGEEPTQWSKILASGYSMGMSTLDNAARLVAYGGMPGGAAASAGTMYGNVFGSTVLDYMGEGASADQAYAMGTLSAAAEAIGESITFTEYLNVKNGAQAAAAAKVAGQNFSWGKFLGHELMHTGVSEATEEGVTEILNYIFDNIVMGDDSKLNQVYQEAVSQPGATNADGWLAVFKDIGGDTFNASVGGFFSGILLGGGEIELNSYEQGVKAGAKNGNKIKTGHSILLDNVNTQVALENAFKEELEDSGTTVSAQARAETIETVANLGLSAVQADAIIRVYDMYASSPNSLLSDGSTALLNNFTKELSDANEKIKDVNTKHDIETKKLLNKQSNLWNSVLEYQEEAHQAVESGDMNAHNKAREKLTNAIKNYSSFAGTFDLEQERIESSHKSDLKKASAGLINAATAMSDGIGAETEYQKNVLTHKISEGRGAGNLAALGERLQLQERASMVADFGAEYAMQIGDQDAWQFWTDVAQARARGEDITDMVAYHPEYVNSMYEEYVHDNLYDDLAKLNSDYVTAEENNDQEGMQKAGQRLEQLREDYGTDIVSSAMEELYGGENGRNEELQIPDGEPGRNVSSEAERIDTRGDQEREAEYGYEGAGASQGGERSSRNPAARWDERSVKLFDDGIRQWNAKHGSTEGYEQVETLTPEQTRVANIAMDYLGGATPFFYRSKGPNMFHGLAMGGNEYIMDDGDDTIVFTMGHERAHNSPNIQRAAREALDALGQRGEQMFRDWAGKLAEAGIEVKTAGPGRQSALNEFYSDMYGAFLYDLTTGKTVAPSLGMDASDVAEFYPAFLDQMAVYAENDVEESPGPFQRLKGLLHGGEQSERSVFASAGLDVTKDEDGSFVVKKNGVPVTSVTSDDIYRSSVGAMIHQAEQQGFITADDAKIQRDFMRDLVNMMIEKKDGDLVWAWAGTQVFSAITNNSDPQYDNTVDFTTICRKTQALIDAMSAKMVELQHGLSDQDILDLQKELADRGETVPCPVCYVFSRWVGIGSVLDRIKGYQEQYADIDVAKAALQNHTDPQAETWLTGVRLKQGYKPVPPEILYDLNKGGEFATNYPLTWKYRTTRGPALGKAMTPYAEMNTGDVVQGIRKKDKKKILKGDKSPFKIVGEDGTFGPAALKELLASERKMKAQNLMGGLRYQSTSDFRTDYALDYLLSFFDVQAVGGKIQTYTKVPEGARLLAAVGADVNLSVMPKGKGWVISANGEPVLDCSSVTGMDFKTAVDIKNKHDNVQLIMVGINDDHIILSLKNSDIGFVIPYHASGGKADFVTAMARNLGEKVNLSEYTNYEDCQTDYINPNSTPEQIAARDLRMRILMHQVKGLSDADQAILDSNAYLRDLYNRFYVEGVDNDCYGVKLPKAQAKMLMPYEYWDTSSTIDNADVNGERFVEYCESLGIIPRFSGVTVRNGKIVELDHGGFAGKEGYWKVLIDRPMYNRDGSYHRQRTINVSGVTSDMLNEGNALFSSRGVEGTRDAEYMSAVERGDMETAQRMVDEAAEAAGIYKRNAGEETNIYIPDGVNLSDGTSVSFTDRILDGEKLGETRGLNTHFPVGKWLGIAKDGEVVGRVMFGNPIEITKDSPEYQSAYIEGTNYDIPDGQTKLYYPIVNTMDFRDAPRQIVRNGNYGAYQLKSNDPVVYDDYGNVIPLSQRFNPDNSDFRYSGRSVNGQTSNRQTRRMEQAQQAEEMFDAGVVLSDYIQSKDFDPEVAAHLRGIMLRNGMRVGGRLSDQEMADIQNESLGWTKKALLSLQAPVRVFKKMGRAWDNKTDEGVMRNFHASKKYSDLYYSYLSSQLQQENLFKTDSLERIQKINASENDSILAQLIGEQKIDLQTAMGAVTDGKDILIPIGDGVMVLDHKGRVRYIIDSLEGYLYDDNVLKRLADQRREIEAVRRDNKPNKPDRIKQIQQRGAAPKSLSGAKLEKTSTGYRIVSGDDILYEMKNAKSAYSDKARQLSNELSDIYQNMHGMVQQSLVENGYAPIGTIEHYFPHFSQGQEGLGQAIEYLRQEDLPIGIAGMTDTFTPGKPWARNLLSRIGDRTDYNAVRGFNNYLNSVSDVIYMTPVIQRLRQLENMLRTGGKTEATNEANTNLVTWLHEYTNGIANKKSALDRGMEAMFGRKVYQIIPKISGLAGSAYVVGNVSSALTNFGASFQASGEMAPKYIFKGLFDTAADNAEFGDDIERVIPFLTNRLTELDQIALNSGEIAKTKGMKLLTWLMSAVDGFSSKMVARAKYYECMDRGMSQEEAIRETNKYCVELFAERSKGSKPTVFNSKTLSPFTQFQLEPWNQMWHWVDIHDRNLMKEYERILKQNNGVMDGIDYGKMENRINRMGVAWKDIGQILGRMIAMSIFGMMMRAVRGTDSHWNPAGLVSDAARGYENEGVNGIWDAIVAQAENNAPGVSALTGSYQVPALSIMKNMIDTLAGDWDSNGSLIDNLGGIARNIPEASLYAIPAGSQARKSWKGIQAYEAGGNYTPSGRLRYPIEQNVPNAIRSAVFGQSATAPQGYRWGKDVLTDKQTEYYQQAVDEGADPNDVYNFLLNDYNSRATQTKATKLAALATSDLDDEGVEFMAKVLGIEWDGDLESAAYDALVAEEEKMEDNDKLKDSTKERRQEAYDFYLDLLS